MCAFGCAIKNIVFYDYLSFLVRLKIFSADTIDSGSPEALSMPMSRVRMRALHVV